MINLFDTYNQTSWDLHYSLILGGYQNTTIVLNDDGFLPDDVTSPYIYFTGFDEVDGQPLYFDKVVVPEFWEIIGNNSQGEIFHYHKKRGHIHYSKPTHQRHVRAVDWYDDSGRLRVTDCYNKAGYRFAQTTYNTQAQAVLTSYFDKDNQEIIVENHGTGDVILNWNGQVHIFKSKTDFVIFYLKTAGYNLDRIFYNSLSTPFLVAYYLGESGQDVLFWEEDFTGSVPGNMSALLQNQNRQTKIVVQKHETYHKLLPHLSITDQEKVVFLGFNYHFVRQNTKHREALLLTNSDQIEQLEEIVSQLPEWHFHVGAITEMSGKLMALGKYSNLSLYPNISMANVQKLYRQCDVYLDINQGNEILNSVRVAFENNQIILAFFSTLHNSDFVAPENRFELQQGSELRELLRQMAHNEDLFEKRLGYQREWANVETAERYRSVIH